MAQHRLARAADQASFAESFSLVAPACIEGCGCAANDVFGSGHPHRLEQKASHCEAAFGPISHQESHRRTRKRKLWRIFWYSTSTHLATLRTMRMERPRPTRRLFAM